MIVGLCSTYREGQVGAGAIRSARSACDRVAVFEGPVEGLEASGDPTPLGANDTKGIFVKHDEWESDAAKRQDMLVWAKREHQKFGHNEPLWVVWIDGDEALIYPEYLRDWLYRASFVDGAYNWNIRLVELDGSTVLCAGKCIRGDMVFQYLVSSYQVQLENGMIVALPNVRNWMPWQEKYDDAGNYYTKESPITASRRPPLHGEPHLLHRSGLRSPNRMIRRLHDSEAQWFPEALAAAGLEGVESESDMCPRGGIHIEGPDLLCMKCGEQIKP